MNLVSLNIETIQIGHPLPFALRGADGVLRVYAERGSGRLLGAAMMAVGGEHLAHLLAWAVQRGETAGSLLQAPFYHPVLEEMLQSALQDVVRQLGDHQPWPMGLRPMEFAQGSESA